jgi:hypothetical protein
LCIRARVRGRRVRGRPARGTWRSAPRGRALCLSASRGRASSRLVSRVRAFSRSASPGGTVRARTVPPIPAGGQCEPGRRRFARPRVRGGASRVRRPASRGRADVRRRPCAPNVRYGTLLQGASCGARRSDGDRMAGFSPEDTYGRCAERSGSIRTESRQDFLRVTILPGFGPIPRSDRPLRSPGENLAKNGHRRDGLANPCRAEPN